MADLNFDSVSPPTAWIELSHHPDFAAAARRFARNMLLLCEEDERLCAIFKDAGRYIAAMTAAYLHGIGGLTLPTLKQICAGTGFLSQGRASAILDLLVHIDYLRPPVGAIVGGEYLPTDRFLSAWRRHLQVALDAAALIEPELDGLSKQLAQPDIFTAFLSIQARRLHALARTSDPYPALKLKRAFLEPHAGSQILWTLIGAESHQGLWADGEIKLSLSDLSSRFDVSYLHIKRVLRQAEEEGFLAYHGHGRLTLKPAAAELIRHHVAFQLCELIECGKAMGARMALPAEAAVI